MAEKFSLFIAGLDPLSIALLVLALIAILILLPKAVTEMGIKKLGPIQIEQSNQTLNHLTNKRIEEIDIENRETLWEMTEDFFYDLKEKSPLSCKAVVESIAFAISSPIRTMVLLNHLAPKLNLENQSELSEKITRNINKAFKSTRSNSIPNSCTLSVDVAEISTEKFIPNINEWFEKARQIVAKSCFQKIQVYEETLEETKDKFWKNIYQDCINKNTSYLEGMGWYISKQGKLERA